MVYVFKELFYRLKEFLIPLMQHSRTKDCIVKAIYRQKLKHFFVFARSIMCVGD